MIERLLHAFHSLSLSSLFQVLATLLCHLKEWCNETSPDCVRVEIAGLLGRNWSVFITLEHVAEEKDMCGDVKGCSLSRLFWQMCITLLQDVEEDVREEMCSSLTEMLSSTRCHSSGMYVMYYTINPLF